ncbi:MAG: beta-ketoacyl synthase N-terminal-like domain-containing protein [Ginsengibacter sp.]
MTLRKVAIVGMGGIFPTCKDIDEFSNKIFSNQSCIREWDQAKSRGKKVRSVVSGFVTLEEAGLEEIQSSILQDYPEFYKDTRERIPASNLSTADIGSIWSMFATQDAIAMGGWSEKEVQSEQTGVIIGSGAGGNEVSRKAWHNFFTLDKKTRFLGTHNVDRCMVYRDAANVSCLIKSKGVCESIGSACATGLGNIGYAYRLIAYGLQDRIVAGGTEGTSMESFLGFDAMQVLSRGHAPEKSSRPFDVARNGFVCSFGAGIVALEAHDQAKARGAKILAVIDNYFNNSDGSGDMFAPSFEGQQRLWHGLMGEDKKRLFPDVVKVHGTSTPLGDAIELLSIVTFLGEKGYQVAAPKSQFGHMLGAAGAVELITAILMLQQQKISPCLNSDILNEQPEYFQTESAWQGARKPLAAYRDLLPQYAAEKEINRIVCLNYGFGSTNSAMVISKDIHD